jgi:hypothetical protein
MRLSVEKALKSGSQTSPRETRSGSRVWRASWGRNASTRDFTLPRHVVYLHLHPHFHLSPSSRAYSRAFSHALSHVSLGVSSSPSSTISAVQLPIAYTALYPYSSQRAHCHESASLAYIDFVSSRAQSIMRTTTTRINSFIGHPVANHRDTVNHLSCLIEFASPFRQWTRCL